MRFSFAKNLDPAFETAKPQLKVRRVMAFSLLFPWFFALPMQQRQHPEFPFINEFKLKSECVSAFWKKDRFLEAGVVRPLDWEVGERLPIVYQVHGFGDNHLIAWNLGPKLQKQMQIGELPRMIYVFLNAQYEWGHHEFADSRCNGPWGQALTQEFIPAIEKEFGALAIPQARFLVGHSSGGWSALWLQVNDPDLFGGCWSIAPDPVDFRDFVGIDIYREKNAYTDSKSKPVMLERKDGKFVASIKDYVGNERLSNPIGGQFFSFNAVFSEMGPDGMPKQLFDWDTGAIHREVADSWAKYDISLLLRDRWKALGPKLQGKVHLWIGTLDTYRLEGAVILLKKELDQLHADFDIRLVEGRDHSTIFHPHPELWPRGILPRIYNEMHESWTKHAVGTVKR